MRGTDPRIRIRIKTNEFLTIVFYVHLDVTAFVDQVTNGLQVGGSPGNVGL
jgi:hypothetical protein